MFKVRRCVGALAEVSDPIFVDLWLKKFTLVLALNTSQTLRAPIISLRSNPCSIGEPRLALF